MNFIKFIGLADKINITVRGLIRGSVLETARRSERAADCGDKSVIADLGNI